MSEPNGRIAWRCTCFNARKAARTVTELYDRELAPAGLSAPQFTLLGAIAMLGPGPVSRLAAGLELDRTTLTRNLAVLRKEGWIEMRRGEDRRARVVSLTDIGRRTFDRALPLWRAAQERIEEALGRDRLRRLHDDLGALAALAP